MSDPLYDGFSEKTVGSYHKNSDEHKKRRDILRTSANQRVNINPGEILQDTNNKSAQYCAPDTVQTSEYNNCQDLEADIPYKCLYR